MRLLIGAIFVWMMCSLHLAVGTFDGWRILEILAYGGGLIVCIWMLHDNRSRQRR